MINWLEVGLTILLTYMTKNLFCDYTLLLHHPGRVGLVGSGIATQCLSLVRSVSPVFSASRSELSTFCLANVNFFIIGTTFSVQPYDMKFEFFAFAFTDAADD